MVFTQIHITELHYLEQKITYNTNTTQNTTITVPRIYTKTVTIVIKLLGTFLVILTLTIWEDVTTLSPFFKAAVSFTINISFGTTLASIGQLSAVRMLDIHIKFVHFKFYLMVLDLPAWFISVTLHVDKSLKMAAKLGDCRKLGKFTEL